MKTSLSEFFHSAKTYVDEFGNLLIELFHYLALFVIGGSIIWSALGAFGDMLTQGHASIGDVLLMFIYLELGAMVGVYFKTSAMPVRSLIFIAITALARLLISTIQAHHQIDWGILIVSSSILILVLAALLLRKPADN